MISDHRFAGRSASNRCRLYMRQLLTVLVGVLSGAVGSASGVTEQASARSIALDTPNVTMLESRRFTDQVKRVIEQLYDTPKGGAKTVLFADSALVEFSRDVLTGKGECLGVVAPESHPSIDLVAKSMDSNPWMLGLFTQQVIASPAILFSQRPSGPVMLVPSDGDVRIVTDSSERIHSFEDLATFDVHDATVSMLWSGSRDVKPLWEGMMDSNEMTIALDRKTAYTYDLKDVPGLLGIIAYLCGDTASTRRAPDWPSVLEAERRAKAATRADWPPRQ